jgi:hypothetical protein
VLLAVVALAVCAGGVGGALVLARSRIESTGPAGSSPAASASAATPSSQASSAGRHAGSADACAPLAGAASGFQLATPRGTSTNTGNTLLMVCAATFTSGNARGIVTINASAHQAAPGQSPEQAAQQEFTAAQQRLGAGAQQVKLGDQAFLSSQKTSFSRTVRLLALDSNLTVDVRADLFTTQADEDTAKEFVQNIAKAYIAI